MKDLLTLFTIFFRLGAVTFGGGYAMLPLLQREFVENRHWVTEEELADYYAIGQCTPGIIAVNTSTFIGNRRKGILGGIVATLGFVTPSVIIIMIIAAFIQNFAELEIVKNAFAGVRVCVCVLILIAVQKLMKKSVIDLPTVIICAVVALLSILTPVSPVLLIVLAALSGVIIKAVKEKMTAQKQ